MAPKIDTNTPGSEKDVEEKFVQIKERDFDALCKNQIDTMGWVKENKEKIQGFDGSAEKVAELDRRMKEFDDVLEKFREAQAGSKIFSVGNFKNQFDSPQEALLFKSEDPKIQEWQKRSDMLFLGTIMEKTPSIHWLSDKLRDAGGIKASHFHKQFQIDTKAMFGGSGNVGADFVPTILSSQLFEEVRLALRVSNLHSHFPMTSKTVEIPGQGSAIFAELIPESTSDSSTKITAKTPSSRKVPFTLQKLGLRVLTSSELEEDSIIPTLQYIRNEVVYALSTGEEYALINGDTAGTLDKTDQAGDIIHSKSNLKAFDGYRKIVRDIGGLVISSGGTLTASHARRCFGSMGKYAVDPTRLSWVTGTRGMFTHFMALGNVQTLDKLGPNAVILSGQLGAYLGVPIVVSEWVRNDIGLSGFTGGSAGGTSTHISLVHTPTIQVGEGRAVKIETEKDIDTDQIKVVGTRRLDAENMYATASDKTVMTEIKGLTS